MNKPLTDANIRALQPPITGRIEIPDPSCHGLWLRVAAGGAKTFEFRYRPAGSRESERLTLGLYPDVSLGDARAIADKLRTQIAGGTNPSAHRREASARTFAALADRYLKEHARRFKRSADKDDRNLRLHILPCWKDKDFTAISRGDVIALVDELVSAGKPTLANHVQRLISKVFAFAMDVALAEQNPAARLRLRGVTRTKTRVLSDDEIRLFWRYGIEASKSPTIGLSLGLVLATGCRPGEAAGMARSELEFDAEGVPVSWTIPAARSKNGLAHFVPFSALAGDLIVAAMTLAVENTTFVFASHSASGHVDTVALATAMARLPAMLPDKEPGATSWKANVPTAHDLRRTCATRLSAAGVPAEDVAAILNHVRAGATGRPYDLYRRADEKRRALDRWAGLLTAVIEQASASNVVAAADPSLIPPGAAMNTTVGHADS
jgi:integrase